jgi:carbonic anhydrase
LRSPIVAVRGLDYNPTPMPRTIPTNGMPPEAALERLRAGNHRFVTGEESAVRQWRPGLAAGQSPFATILGCSDARAPAEYVFDQGLGDLFVIRVAGNIVAPSLVGSIEFAASEFGTRLVVVMGHTQCGAVRATVRTLANEVGPGSRNIRSIVDRIAPHLANEDTSPLDAEAHMLAAVRINAQASARELPNSSDLLRELVLEGQVKIVAAVYDLATGIVTFLDA